MLRDDAQSIPQRFMSFSRFASPAQAITSTNCNPLFETLINATINAKSKLPYVSRTELLLGTDTLFSLKVCPPRGILKIVQLNFNGALNPS
jgi:hypothetical protein